MPLFHTKSGFIKAARTGDVEEIRHCLIYRVPDKFDVDVTDEKGITALAHAARAGHTAIVKLLLARGADPDMPARDGVTPLMAAVEAGKSQAAVALIAGGAKPDTHNPDYVYPLHLAAFAGDIDVVKALAGAQADLNVTVRTNGRTALHWAIEKDMISVVEFLAGAGARTDIADKAGKTAFDMAKSRPHLLKILQKCAAPVATPAAAVSSADAAERWTLVGRNRVAHNGSYPDIGRKITEIFNFESRERTVITENLKTGAESLSTPERFDHINADALQKALSEFRKLGGEADDGFVFGKQAPRNGFKL